MRFLVLSKKSLTTNDQLLNTKKEKRVGKAKRGRKTKHVKLTGLLMLRSKHGVNNSENPQSMTKNIYLNTGLASLIAFILLIVMKYTWPQIDYSINEVILGNIELPEVDKGNLIKSMGTNYALDTIFIFSWIGSWCGLFLHFKSINTKLIGICFGLSLTGALLDILENSIFYALLFGANKSADIILFIHYIIRDISFWLPMIASLILALTIPKQKGLATAFLKFAGIIGVLFAILGMYIPYFAAIPYYWFGLWFLAATIFLFDNYRGETNLRVSEK